MPGDGIALRVLVGVCVSVLVCQKASRQDVVVVNRIFGSSSVTEPGSCRFGIGLGGSPVLGGYPEDAMITDITVHVQHLAKTSCLFVFL